MNAPLNALIPPVFFAVLLCCCKNTMPLAVTNHQAAAVTFLPVVHAGNLQVRGVPVLTVPTGRTNRPCIVSLKDPGTGAGCWT